MSQGTESCHYIYGLPAATLFNQISTTLFLIGFRIEVETLFKRLRRHDIILTGDIPQTITWLFSVLCSWSWQKFASSAGYFTLFKSFFDFVRRFSRGFSGKKLTFTPLLWLVAEILIQEQLHGRTPISCTKARIHYPGYSITLSCSCSKNSDL